MKIFLAGNAPWFEDGLYNDIIEKYSPYILGSFWYKSESDKNIAKYGDYILDSGAFTAMRNQGKTSAISWEKYVDAYGAYVKENGIQKFIELDLDDVIGIEKTKKLTKRLEAVAGKQCIPVWHEPRGKKGFEEMCEQYSYVAFGGVAIAKAKIKKQYEAVFPYFIKTAHRYNCYIHGLGYTSLDGLQRFHFDSVDSSSWLYGRYGQICVFKRNKIKIIQRPKDKVVKSMKDVMRHNFEQWCIFQKYAEVKL